MDDTLLLVAIDNDLRTEARTVTRLAQYINSSTVRGTTKFDVRFLTDSFGTRIKSVFVSPDISSSQVLTLRKIKEPKSFIFICVDSIPVGRGFIELGSKLSDNRCYPGSGVYGLYFEDDAEREEFILKSRISGHKEIPLLTPFLIQDKEHYESLINYSYVIHNFIDSIKWGILKSDVDEYRLESIVNEIDENFDKFYGTYVIFDLVLRRSKFSMALDTYKATIASYILNYTDSKSNFSDNDYITTQPINYLIQLMGGDSIVGDVSFMKSVIYNITDVKDLRTDSYFK